MDDTELASWVVLHSLPGMGPVTMRRLLDRFGSARGVLEAGQGNAILESPGVTTALAEAIRRAAASVAHAARRVEDLHRCGVRIVRIVDPAYPPALRDLRNPPPLLYIYGDIGDRDARAVGIVGTTDPSPRGRAIAEEFGARFAAAGVTVVSGYAHGIDAAAHRGAFRGGGRSVLCLPHGLRRFRARPDFPPLAEIGKRGALLSECPPDALWSRAAAIARNRIIAALGRALLVIETQPHGGAFHTVSAAESLGRPIFAVRFREPPESARGNAMLIARGATPLCAFAEINEVLRVVDAPARSD